MLGRWLRRVPQSNKVIVIKKNAVGKGLSGGSCFLRRVVCLGWSVEGGEEISCVYLILFITRINVYFVVFDSVKIVSIQFFEKNLFVWIFYFGLVS